MDVNVGPEDMVAFFVTYKWWIAACTPVVLAIIVLRARG